MQRHSCKPKLDCRKSSRGICSAKTCRMLFHICLTPVMGVLSLTRNSFLKKNINKSSMLRYTNAYKFTILGTKWVAMARHGPILKDNEATGSGKVFKYLRGFRDIIKNQKWPPKSKKSKNPYFTVFFNIWGRRHGRSPSTIRNPDYWL